MAINKKKVITIVLFVSVIIVVASPLFFYQRFMETYLKEVMFKSYYKCYKNRDK